ncbi:MAG: UDP-4-amino-4,6-dideoxy-N-acetyl-beta-L-altrosamine transaminase [Magnetospirillum sp.]|nr:UDP-4-amino-4,6-dideoxy-N-acetyl-beta-L-altrosamine transaminase [Magnetospirillum sp.]
MAGSDFLPYGRHTIDEDDIAAVVRVLRGDWLTSGPKVEELERRLEAETGAAHAVVCNSGTAALHLAALALDLGPGDLVAVPAVTFAATANAARFVGADVVFCDVDADTGLMTAATLAEAQARAGRRLSAVFPVHLAGQTVDMPALRAQCRPGGIPLVEDACHAIGTRVEGVPVGACAASEMACFSFHPVKTVAMGEGGAVTTNDAAKAARMRRLRGHGITRDLAEFQAPEQAFDSRGEANPWYYEMVELGYNFRASDINCALALSQLDKLAPFAARRRHLADLYAAQLAPLADRVRPLARVPGCVPAWHLYVVRIPFDQLGLERAAVMAALKQHGVGSQVHYLPVYRQPYYAALAPYPRLPGAEAYYDTCLSLPLFPAMADDDVRRVVDALAEILGA